MSIKKKGDEGYYLPSAPLDQLVGRKEAEVFLEKISKKWKEANPDPFFVVPSTFEGKCKKFGVVKFDYQTEWITWVNGLRKIMPLSLEVETKIKYIKKVERYTKCIEKR